jgi:dienelactone hydrolase
MFAFSTRSLQLALLAAGTAVAASWNAAAWPGFTWQEWQKITGLEKPQITTPQSGHGDLLPLLKTDFESKVPISAVEQWREKQTRILGTLTEFFGTPGNIIPPEPSAKELGRDDMGAYERIHLQIASEPDDTIPAYLLRPKKLAVAKVPAMIVLHQTQAPGKQEPCGMTGNPEMAFAREFAERGVLCIAPDAIGFGERIPKDAQPYANALDFYRKHPKWSFFGKMIWDVGRVIDYLETLPEVDASRIGIMGHSHGAYGSITAAVFEPRVRLVVASCGFTTLRTDPAPNRWSHLTALMPRLGYYVDDIDQAPFDWHEIIACIAPKPFFNWATLNDDIFPKTDNLADVYVQEGQVYDLFGKKSAFVGKLAPGAHRFPADVRKEAYDWIEKEFERMKK